MRWFRREEPLHERLAREAGIDDELAEDSVPDHDGEEDFDEDGLAEHEPSEADEGGDEENRPLERPPVLPVSESGDPSRTAGEDDFLLRPGGYDAFAWTDAPGVHGNRLEFVVLPDRSLVVLQQDGEESLDAFADAIEAQIAPPFRARALREKGERWSVYARTTHVVHLPSVDADEVELTVLAGETTTTVDADLEPLYRLAEERGYDDYFARAEWLEDDVYEVRMEAL